MRSLVLILLAYSLVISCNKENTDDKEYTLIGKWQLVEVMAVDDSFNTYWVNVENTDDSYFIAINNSGNFTSNRFNECTQGSYIINGNENTISFIYDCDGFTTGIEEPSGTFTEKFIFNNNYLILTPTYLTCIEGGCEKKFKKNK